MIFFFLGTLWCGDGNVARNPDDIGVFSDTDECCKQHDHCPFTIKAGYNRELLKNNGIFTRFVKLIINIIINFA